MKLNQYGYHADEKQLHGHIMSMGSLKLLIIQKLMAGGYHNIKIRIVDCRCGEVEEYSNMSDFVAHDHANEFEILVYDLHIVHMNASDEDIVIANIADDTYNDER